jgi:biotin transport system substrate-specific component
MTMSENYQLRMSVYASLLAALMAAGAYLAIPIGPVPVVLQNMFVFLAPLLLGRRWGLASLCVYLLAGACGLPVFAGGMGGIGRFVGPTGGFLLGYLPAVLLIGLVVSGKRPCFWRDVLAMVAGSIALYACGLAWLKIILGFSWGRAIAVGMFPFLIGDAFKIVAAAALAKSLRPVLMINSTAAASAAPQPAGNTG